MRSIKNIFKCLFSCLLVFGIINLFTNSMGASTSDSKDKISSATYLLPSQTHPGNFPLSQAPMFVTIGFDDNAYSGITGSGGTGGMQWAVNMMTGRTNPLGTQNPGTYDSTPATITFYNCSYYLASWISESPNYVKKAWRTAYDAGHEIGNHSQSHSHGNAFSIAQWENEMQQCNVWLSKPYLDLLPVTDPDNTKGIGVPANQIFGFRTPFLEYNDNTFYAIKNIGFAYDCSIEEGFEYDQDGTNFYWPYTLDNGSPGHDIQVEWGSKEPLSNHPGLWELPVHTVIVPPELRATMKARQSWFDEASGKITGFDYNLWVSFSMTKAEFLATLKHTLDLRLQGNRAPLMLGAHTDYYSSKYSTPSATVLERQQAIEEFLDYAQSKSVVRVVSMKKILDWMKDPVPLDRVLTKYTITPTADANGSISPSIPVEEFKGESQTFTFAPDSGYEVDTVTVDGTALNPTPGYSYTFTDLSANHSINVSFTIKSLGSETNPFPKSENFPGLIKPNHVSQAALNNAVKSYFTYWQNSYVKPSNGNTPGGGYFVQADSTGGHTYPVKSNSEAHGYGMIIFALMGDKTYFDGMYNMYNQHRSTIDNDLMSWVISEEELVSQGSTSATDGDFDIAYSLLLAHEQWGSAGSINYLEEARRIISDGIKQSEMSSVSYRTKLGDWDDNEYSTRPSDWMADHMRVFYRYTNDNFWNTAAGEVYSVASEISTNYSSITGLMPDFVVDSGAKPAQPDFLEGPNDGNFYYNACRFPWRISIDYAHFGTPQAKAALNKIINWLKINTNNDPNNISPGYTLDGQNLPGFVFFDTAFVSPLIAASTVDSEHQAYLNAGWDAIINNHESYYQDSINLLCMLHISGNWWKPGGDIVEYEITATAGANGSITPSGIVNVIEASSSTFNFVANSGYTVDSVTVDGILVSPTPTDSYTFTGVTTNHTISVTFVEQGCTLPLWVYEEIYVEGSQVHHNGHDWEAKWWTQHAEPGTTGEWGVWLDLGPCGTTTTYTINSSAGANGSIDPLGDNIVNKGTDTNYQITANPGYVVDDVSVDGVSVGSPSSYTFTNVQSNHTIAVSFKAGIQYVITASAGPNGSISPSGDVSVSEGGNQTFSIQADTGYGIDTLTVNGAVVSPVSSYSFSNVTANQSISVTFKVSGIAPWEVGVHYAVGARVTFDGFTWENTYDHVSNSAWYPGAPNLWFWVKL